MLSPLLVGGTAFRRCPGKARTVIEVRNETPEDVDAIRDINRSTFSMDNRDSEQP